MAATKRDIVEAAFSWLGIAEYDFDLEPEQLQTALRQMDFMAATWNGKGARIGYALPSSPGASSLDDEAGVPDWALEALSMNLAVRLASAFGKTVSPDLKAAGRTAYLGILSRSARPQERQLDTTAIPAGAGNKAWRDARDPFLIPNAPTLDAGPDQSIDLE